MISLSFPLSVKICWHWISGSGRFLKGGAREVRFVGQGGLIWGGGRSDWHLITAAGTLGKAWLWPTFGSKYPEVLQVGGQYQGVWGFGGYDDELSRRWWCCWWWWRWWSCWWLTRRSMQWEGRARLNSSKTRTTNTSTVLWLLLLLLNSSTTPPFTEFDPALSPACLLQHAVTQSFWQIGTQNIH